MYLSTRNEALYTRDMINRVELILLAEEKKRASITNRNIQLSQVQKNKIASWNFHRFPVFNPITQ